ncbi:hypothetical protein QMK47_04845 [Pseudomonas sp. P9_35]|uniref:DUF6911 family protein n=1 Tax=unclassified Pseudomonas TaxID=196821 RepID=UPI002A35BD13|nr:MULTISPECIES: hypothetical protein [unclassified Pseudomonas]WPN64328.1 hypothetical protein QMK48_03945 [Pseudomonas sp. P9_32]WPN70079.1 hypothetical protein QMK47_04845 [Pseudomonas sp. P9_35]
MIIGGYTLSPEHGRSQIPLIDQPTLEDVRSIICEYSKVGGVASLSIFPAPETGPYEINLYADSGNYILMLNQYLDDGEHVVRTLNNMSAGAKMVDVLGDYYPESFITRNIDIVISCFQEFLRSGDVSFAVLNS